MADGEILAGDALDTLLEFRASGEYGTGLCRVKGDDGRRESSKVDLQIIVKGVRR